MIIFSSYSCSLFSGLWLYLDFFWIVLDSIFCLIEIAVSGSLHFLVFFLWMLYLINHLPWVLWPYGLKLSFRMWKRLRLLVIVNTLLALILHLDRTLRPNILFPVIFDQFLTSQVGFRLFFCFTFSLAIVKNINHRQWIPIGFVLNVLLQNFDRRD